jgi:hypothetical protein
MAPVVFKRGLITIIANQYAAGLKYCTVHSTTGRFAIRLCLLIGVVSFLICGQQSCFGRVHGSTKKEPQEKCGSRDSFKLRFGSTISSCFGRKQFKTRFGRRFLSRFAGGFGNDLEASWSMTYFFPKNFWILISAGEKESVDCLEVNCSPNRPCGGFLSSVRRPINPLHKLRRTLVQ